MNLVVDELATYLTTALENFKIETKTGTRPPKIFKYFLPTKTKVSEGDFPLVIIRPITGEDNENQTNITVKFICGVFSEDEDGVYDLASLIEKLRKIFLENYELSNKFKIEKPFKWEIYDDQPYPQWLGEITAICNIPQPQVLISPELQKEIFGDGC